MAEAPSVRCPSACLLFAMILFVAGCQDSDKITVYTIPKEKNVPSETDPFGAMPNDAVHSRVRPAPSSATPFDHMLAAFVRNGDRTWFFKLAGPKEAVNNQVQSFKSFARSVRFGEDGNPHWTLPEGWHEEPGNSVRYATLRIGSATPPLEVTVTPLPHFEQSEQDYALANVNRWRTQQMGLAAIKRLDEKDSGVETTDVDGKTMYLVDLGSPNAARSAQPAAPFLKSAAPAPSASPFDRMLAAFVRNGDRTWFFKLAGPKEAVNNQVQSFKSFARSVRFGEDGNPHWTLPEGWHEEPGNSVRYATLRIGSADPPLEVTVTPLPHFEQSEQDYALANVNRWRTQQMGLAAIKRLDEKDSGVETTDVDGKTMYLVDLGSPNEAGSDQPSTNKHKSAAPAPSASPPTQKTQSAELSKSPAPDDDASSDKTGNQNEQDKSADDSSAGSEEKLNRQNAQPEEQDAKPAEDTVTPDEQTAPSGADDSEKSQGAPAPNGETSSSTRSSSDSSSTEQFGHAPLTEGPHDDKTHTSTVSHHGSVAIGGGTC